MKRLLIFPIMLFSIVAFTQGNGGNGKTNTFPNNGNAGIGTLNPQFKLEVVGSGSFTTDVTIGGTIFGAKRLEITDSIKIGNNSLYLGGNGPTGVNNHIYSDNGDIYLQSNSTYNFNTILNTNNGKVGIGTATPISKLHLKDRTCLDCGGPPSGETVYLTLEDNTYTQNQIPNQNNTTTWQVGLTAGQNMNPNTDKFFVRKFGNTNTPFQISGEGKVGINTGTFLPGVGYDTPSALMLDVMGHARFYSLDKNPNDYVRIGYNGANSIIDHFGQGGLLINYYSNKDVAFGGFNKGTSNVFISGALNVCGQIKTTDLYVQTGWCDFVFEKDYQLMSLKERENYIQQNGHLPHIVSAKEVEANGASVANSITGILQNTEELTLYLIEMNKRLENLENENLLLKAKLEKLK